MTEPNGNDYSIPQYSCWKNAKAEDNTSTRLLDALRELVEYADVQTDPRRSVRSRIAFLAAEQLISELDSKERK